MPNCKAKYPKNWHDIAKRIKEKHNWLCERCHHPNDKLAGRVLTVHHLDGDPANCADWNLAALCQKCHLGIDLKHHMANARETRNKKKGLMDLF